ncbi:MAG: HlyD family efflux transporter periplasmic adaptor subunit [Labilithrix sp.]|nr:HlyD family efflux transporter periplasmic adaptor subunit [Labilithrix sp.]MCW5809944.1 HlyD family efflux transporter periplasmic adaptor subunit [Labilithrix sp.]
MVLAKTTLYVVSASSRVETSSNPIPVQAPVAGVVVAASLSLGRSVSQGEVLFVLDAQSFELQRRELEARLVGDRAKLASLVEQVAAEELARDAQSVDVSRGVAAARARSAVAQAAHAGKRSEDEVVGKLAEQALASKLDKLRSASEVQQTSAQAAASAAEVSLQASSGTTALRDRDARIASLRHQQTSLEAEIRVDEAKVAELAYEVERRTVRATVTGTLADVVPLAAGSTLDPGAKVATIVPAGSLRIVARFAPDDAVGLVTKGQRAEMRVTSRPWTQFGTLHGRVLSAGSEPRDGTVRVELEVVEENPRIPLVNGITGDVEVAVAEVSPLEFLLRQAGQKLAPAKSAPMRGPADLPSIAGP